jgi:hypothetical protein
MPAAPEADSCSRTNERTENNPLSYARGTKKSEQGSNSRPQALVRVKTTAGVRNCCVINSPDMLFKKDK